MNVKIGNEMDPRYPEMAAMARRLGVTPPMPPGLAARVGQQLDPRKAEMDSMLRAMVGAATGSPGQACAPTNYPKEVLDSIRALSCPVPVEQLPAGVTPEVAAYIHDIANANKYATPPARIGWQCDSLSFQVPITAANTAFGPVNNTPTKSFAADAIIMASGSSADVLFFVTSLTYDSTNYVDNSPWVSVFFTPDAPCCVCVRQVKIIQLATTISLSGLTGPIATTVAGASATGGSANVSLFGKTLFGGNP